MFRAIFLSFLILNSCLAYQILCLFPTPAPSHQIVFGAYTNALAEHGHEVVVATTHPIKNPHPNISQIDWSFVQQYWIEKMDFAKNSTVSIIGHLRMYLDSITDLFDMELSHPDIQAILQKQQKFDLVVVESSCCAMFEFARILKTPLLVMATTDPVEHAAIGNYVHAVAAPLRTVDTFGPMTFFERFKAKSFDFLMIFVAFLLNRIYKPVLEKHYGPNVRSIEEMAQDIDMLFTNTHPALGYIRPIVPKTVTLGFLHIKDPKPLPTDLQDFLDASQNGVIYCSFGTTVLSERFDQERLQTIMSAFSRLQYDILFKFGNETLENNPKNVKIVKWVPQQDLLLHKNVKLFITQAGQHSLEEAIHRGKVPLLAIPFFGDQFINSKRIEGKELGKILDVDKITSDSLVVTIEEVINNQTYKENIAKLSKIVKDEPMPPNEKAVWWTEYVIRHRGAKHLDYQGRKIPTYQFYYLDVVAAYCVVSLLLFLIVKIMVKLWLRLIRKCFDKTIKIE